VHLLRKPAMLDVELLLGRKGAIARWRRVSRAEGDSAGFPTG
jgi:hypothetical protein